jgi:hypothetical protein
MTLKEKASEDGQGLAGHALRPARTAKGASCLETPCGKRVSKHEAPLGGPLPTPRYAPK